LQKQNKPLTQKNASDIFDNYNNKSDYLIKNKQEVIKLVLAYQERPSQAIPPELMHQAQQEKKTAEEPSLLFDDPEERIASEAVEEEPLIHPTTVTSAPAQQLTGRAKAYAEAKAARSATQQTQPVSQQPQLSVQPPTVTSAPAQQLTGRAKAYAEARAARESTIQPTQPVSQQPQLSPQTPAVISAPAPQLTGRAKAYAAARAAKEKAAQQQQFQGQELLELSETQNNQFASILYNIGGIPEEKLKTYQLNDFINYIVEKIRVQMSPQEILGHAQRFITKYNKSQEEIQQRTDEEKDFLRQAHEGAKKVATYLQSQQGQQRPQGEEEVENDSFN
ncbi:MAG: hypothetical protein ACRCUQ_02100, partial [Alphaproteobacteria bacterium]